MAPIPLGTRPYLVTDKRSNIVYDDREYFSGQVAWLPKDVGETNVADGILEGPLEIEQVKQVEEANARAAEAAGALAAEDKKAAEEEAAKQAQYDEYIKRANSPEVHAARQHAVKKTDEPTKDGE